jgi:hypothetical protein
MLITLGKRRAVLLLTALLATSLIGLGEAWGSASVSVEGFVHGPSGEPLQNASIRLWGFYLEAETTTDSMGHYELSATTTQVSCQLYAFYDEPDTDGYDLLPSQSRLDTGEDATLSANFTLRPAATVRVTGQLKPVESTRKITKYAFEVVDALDGRVIELGEYRLTYGTGMNVQSYFLDLDTMTLIVPADAPFWVDVSSSYQHERYPPSRYRRYRWGWGSGRTRIETFNKFNITEGEGFALGAGEILELDIRKYSLTADLTRIHPMVEEVEVDLSDVEGQGFYVAAESHDIQETKEFLSGIDEKIESQEYEGAYVDLRQAYLKLLSVRGRLEAAVYEAGVSLKILMVFTAVTSVALGALLANNGPLKLLLTLGSFVPMILYLRQVFPGSAVIEPGPSQASPDIGLVRAHDTLLETGVSRERRDRARQLHNHGGRLAAGGSARLEPVASGAGRCGGRRRIGEGGSPRGRLLHGEQEPQEEKATLPVHLRHHPDPHHELRSPHFALHQLRTDIQQIRRRQARRGGDHGEDAVLPPQQRVREGGLLPHHRGDDRVGLGERRRRQRGGAGGEHPKPPTLREDRGVAHLRRDRDPARR